MTTRRLLKLFLSYFLRGLLFTIPLTVIVWGVIKAFGLIDSLLPLEIPGLGIAILLVFVTVIGYVGSTIIAEPIKRYFGRLLDRAPLLKTTYTALSDFLGTIVGKRKSFSHPVLVKFDQNSDVERLGFVTEDDLTELGLPAGRIAVYVPFSYSFSGNLIIVPSANVTPVDAKSADVMKFIVSGGVAQIEKE